MERKCTHCGKSFTAQRSTAKYCGSSCRGMATQRRQQAEGNVVQIKAATPEPATDPAVKGDMELATERRLIELDQVDTVRGVQALAVAGRIDRSTFDTGSAFASMSRELSRLMDEIEAKAKPKKNPLVVMSQARDELRGLA